MTSSPPSWQAHKAADYDSTMTSRCATLLAQIIAEPARRQDPHFGSSEAWENTFLILDREHSRKGAKSILTISCNCLDASPRHKLDLHSTDLCLSIQL